MLLILWEYIARERRQEEFEAFYRPDGPWTQLFRTAPGFVSTTLWKDRRNPRRFVVADRWTDAVLYEEFRHAHAAAYAALAERSKHLLDREVELGRFDATE